MSPTIPLGDLVDIRGGGTPSRGVKEYWGGPIPWATVKDFKSNCLSQTVESITRQGVVNSATNIIPAGSVIVPTRMAVGKAAINTVDMAINQDLKAIMPREHIDPRFLLYFLSSQAKFLETRAQGATVKGIKLDLLRSLEFPNLPLREQCRVAAILDKADSIRRKREQALALTDDLLKSTFLERFGDPAMNMRNLPTAPIRSLGDVITGNTPPRSNSENYGDGIEWIKSDNINTTYHYLTPAKERLSDLGERICRKVPAGATLVTCIAGSPECIGNAAMSDREVAFNQQINAVIPSASTDQYFLYAQILVAKQIIQNSSTNSMKGMVSKGKFKEIEFLAPDYGLQEEFGRCFKKILKVGASTNTALRNDHDLFSSLSQRAFRGEL